MTGRSDSILLTSPQPESALDPEQQSPLPGEPPVDDELYRLGSDPVEDRFEQASPVDT